MRYCVAFQRPVHNFDNRLEETPLSVADYLLIYRLSIIFVERMWRALHCGWRLSVQFTFITLISQQKGEDTVFNAAVKTNENPLRNLCTDFLTIGTHLLLSSCGFNLKPISLYSTVYSEMWMDHIPTQTLMPLKMMEIFSYLY